MAYDRYDSRRDRWQDDQRGRDERGFFERAGDEIASWFGDDDRHDRMDRERGSSGRDREYDRGYGRDYDRDRGAFRSRSHDRYGDRDEGRSSARPMNWTSSDRDYRSGSQRSSRDYERMGYGGQDHDFSSRGGLGGSSGSDYRSPTGPSFGYGGGFGAGTSGGYGSGGYASGYLGRERDRDRGGYDRSESPWGRDDYRNTSYAGSERHHDRHYAAWKQRQMDELDRDYDDYHRENQSRFEQEFGRWRDNRQQKRGLLSKVREHMDVVGSDGETIGKVDKVRGDHIILTKSDSDDNRHHSIRCTMVDTVEGDQVRLDMPAEEAKSRWSDAEGSSNHRDEDTNLNRSFAGTYEDQ